MAKDVDEGFYERADEHLRVASDQLDAVSQGRVSASLMYACARFNVWVSASHRETPADVKRAYGQTIEYFVAEYRKMLVKNLDDYLENFPQDRHAPKPD